MANAITFRSPSKIIKAFPAVLVLQLQDRQLTYEAEEDNTRYPYVAITWKYLCNNSSTRKLRILIYSYKTLGKVSNCPFSIWVNTFGLRMHGL